MKQPFRNTKLNQQQNSADSVSTLSQSEQQNPMPFRFLKFLFQKGTVL